MFAKFKNPADTELPEEILARNVTYDDIQDGGIVDAF